MASNLFGQPSKDDIKVGYVDPVLGYVSGVSICEANAYAEKNPGTTFVFKNGNNVLKYLTINEVNKLTPSDLESNKECEGIDQKKVCGPPIINIYGGGGVGAQANPVIGSDGAILAVDVVRGGHGYQYAPQVDAIDHCNYAAGAVLLAEIGEVSDGFETYETEEDFEEYELCNDTDVGYGDLYGPNGEYIGPWDPNSYAILGGDPIKQEIDDYQKIVRALARTPFWDTRKKSPTKITSSDTNVTLSQVYKVTDSSHVELVRSKGNKDYVAWNEYMNTYAISPVSPSNVKGSDYAGILFTMEWNEDFPVTGEYTFRGLCDNIAQLYIDNEKVTDLGSFADPVRDTKKLINEGIHNIRIDLFNVPVYETKQTQEATTLVSTSSDIKPKFIQKGSDYYLEVTGTGSGKINFVMEVNDSPVIAGLALEELVLPTDGEKIKFTRKGTTGNFAGNVFAIPQKETIKGSGNFTAGKTYGPMKIKGAVAGAGPVKVSSNKIGFLDADGNDENVKLIIAEVKNSKTTSSSSPSTTSTTASSEASLKTTKVFNTLDYIDKADRKLWRINSTAGPNSDFLNQFGISPFDTTTKEAQSDSFAGTHLIRWENINFPVSGYYNIDIMVDDNVKLYIGNASTGGKIDDGTGKKDEIIIKKNGYSSPGKSTGKTTEARFFTAGNYRIRAELEQIQGKPLGKGNPMALALNIEVVTADTKVVSPKSWNENPMGVSVTIDAPPEPPPPQETVPEQEGRCPNNPIWSTRFPQISGYWYPVNFPGPRTITETITEFTEVPTTGDKQEVEFEIFASGSDGLSFVFTSVDGTDSFSFFAPSKNKKTIKQKVNILKNVNYVVKAKEDSAKYNSVEQGLIKSGTKDKEGGVGTSNKIFADYISSKNDNDDIQITASSGSFTSSNKRKAKNSGRNTYDLTYRLDAAPGTKNTASTTTRTYDAPGWSAFMNRYAISPVKPLDTPGSDKSGATYSTSWSINIPYNGFYGLKGTVDNRGKISIDDKEVSTLDPFNTVSPETKKVFLTKGLHKITAELYNRPVITSNTINQKIFRTKDWQVSGSTTTPIAASLLPKFVEINSNYYLQVGGSGTGKISIIAEVDDSPAIAGIAAAEIIIPSDDTKLRFTRTGTTGIFAGNVFAILSDETLKRTGVFTAGKTYGPIEIKGASPGSGTPIVSLDGSKISLLDADGNDANIKLIITDIKPEEQVIVSYNSIVGGTVKDGVIYDGPSLFHYQDSRWGGFMNENSVSPYLVPPPLNSDNRNINGVKTYTWKNVVFPESGQYKISFQADNIGVLYIGGTKVLETTDFISDSPLENINISSGTYDIVVEVDNIPDNTDIFEKNPVGFALEITKDILLNSTDQTPWSSNPMGISAILIPPPCPKRISGKGVVKRIVPLEPGGPYLPTPAQPGISTTYPVLLQLTDVIVPPDGSGINYGSNDIINVSPNNGAVLNYTPGPFGSIKSVEVVSPGIGFTVYPDITIESETGVNFKAIPVLTPVRDPIQAPPDRLIQVTDLVGLKQNGYIQGRAYFGSVFYKNGVRYAGVYETTGELIQVYDTLQESIDAQVTTAPSAIERSGTDTELSSNNPRLNIPNTPENLV